MKKFLTALFLLAASFAHADGHPATAPGQRYALTNSTSTDLRVSSLYSSGTITTPGLISMGSGTVQGNLTITNKMSAAQSRLSNASPSAGWAWVSTDGIGNGNWGLPNSTMPTRQVLTSGSAVYMTPAGVRQLHVHLKGGGGGGGGFNTNGTNGALTGFVVTAFGGIGGGANANGSFGGTGGCGGSGSALRICGQNGGSAASSLSGVGGGSGGGAQVTDNVYIVGNDGVTNSGGGGGGGNETAARASGGGGEGESADIIINNPNPSYPFSVGVGGAGGLEGGVHHGGNGGSGIIVVDEFYQ